jgi:hypothetical protein
VCVWPCSVTGGPTLWDEEWVNERVGKKFVVSDWEHGRYAKFEHAAGVKRDGDGGLVYCKARPAIEAMSATVSIVTGIPSDELKAGKLSGMHFVRHLAGELTEHLEWPDEDANVVGDWADQKKEPDGSYAAPAAKRPRRQSTRTKYYAPNASYARQMKVRLRFYAAMAAAFQHYGVDKISRDTTWEDLFPKPPPAALEPFYGPAVA